MKTDILINLLDEHNEGNLLATDKLQPNKVIYLKSKENELLYEKLEKYHKSIFPQIDIVSYSISNGDIKGINEILDKMSIEETIINITGGKRINSLILLNQALIRKFNIIYVDILNKRWYQLGLNANDKSEKFKDIYLEDILRITGANILLDSTQISTYPNIIKITEKIYENLDIWYKYKHRLYDNNVFIHDYTDNSKVLVDLQELEEEEVKILKACLKYLVEIDGIIYKKIKNKIKINFQKNYLKSFIFKSGTWLEVLTNIVVREINEIDDVKCGVVFVWNEEDSKVKNEFDVLAVKDDILICISCKDSAKYDENALNELDVYSKRLGGINAKKILVATKEPNKKCINERANAMGISLIILDRDIKKFKNSLKTIINS
ncbi:Card1-like endonuclease domain-containing protein [Clostridium sp. CTA-5]